MENKKNIVLIGMMGCGKTTVAQLLSEKLKNFQYVDIDSEIEKSENKTISEIFETKGEDYFRNLESLFIQKYSQTQNQIISTGGGIVENQFNISNLKENGVIFYLKASIDELYRRIYKSTNRPLLKHNSPKERLNELLKKRAPLYKLSDFEIETEQKTLENIVSEILKKYETIN